jgi:hypothetical protein
MQVVGTIFRESDFGENVMSALERCFAFRDSRMAAMSPPPWFVEMVEEADDWDAAIRSAGFSPTEEFGEGGDNLAIYRNEKAEYLITYGDYNETIAYIFLANVAEYLECRAKLIAPLATLIMETDKHFEWQEARRRRRAS